MSRLAVAKPEQNHLFAAFPAEIKNSLLSHLELVTLPLGKVLYELNGVMREVYFPTNSIVSLMYTTESGASSEISVVGNDGFVGLALFMGGESTSNSAVVKSAGYAFKLPWKRFKEEIQNSTELSALLLRYTQCFITQMAQTSVCNRHHSIEQQFCRWLLFSLDRLHNNRLTMTHELIANMLGVRREGVTDAAGKLQKLGVIAYSRGRITVLDRPTLESLSCECYGVVKKETDRILPFKLTQIIPINPSARKVIPGINSAT